MEINLSNLAILLCVSYLAGSIPAAVWIGKGFYGIDVREHGSGNAGSTNVYRILGAKAGVAVQVIDILKGWFPVFLAGKLNIIGIDPQSVLIMQLIAGIVSVLGHVFPVFAGFKGGKGVNTLLGMMFGIHPFATTCSGLTFICVLLSTKYVSLGSMLGALTFPFTLLILNDSPNLLVYTGFIAFILIVITHRENIKRLMNGTESKANLFQKKTK